MTHAALYALAAIGLLSAMDAVAKYLAPSFNTLQLTFLRFVAGSVLATLVLVVVRPGWPSRETVKVNAARGLLIVLTSTLFFHAVSVLPFAEVMALAFVAPLFMAILGALILGERIGPRVVAALVIGFAGMLFIVWNRIGASGYGEQAAIGVAAVIVSAIGYALSMVLLRSRATLDRAEVIVHLQNLVPCLALAIPAAFVWVPPTPAQWAIFAGMGVLGVTGHLLLAHAFARAEAAKLAPLEYTALFWGVVIGWAGFGEIPSVATLAGAALIVAGTVIVARK